MKQNKRRTATVVYIFIFMLTVSGCVRKGKEQDKVYQETGMFEWSEEAVCEPEEALYLAKELGITKWYQETNGMTEVEATGKFVKALHNRKIEVYALLGAVEWGYEEDGATLLAHLEKIVQYNVQSSEKEKFDGVMLDIEPYISDSWKENPEEYMDRYISCMKKGYKFAQKNHLRTAICIPRHYDNQGLTSGLEELIKETCDEVAVMNYSCGNEIEAIRTEAALSEKWTARIGKRYLAVNFTEQDLVCGEMMNGFTLRKLAGVEGVLVASFSSIPEGEIYGNFEGAFIPDGEFNANGFLQTPSNGSRDLLCPDFFEKDGVEYCYVASYLYQEESSLKDYQGEKFEDLPSGEQNHVYRIHEKLETLPEVLPGRRLMVLNDKMEVVYDSQNPKDYKAIEAGYISFI